MRISRPLALALVTSAFLGHTVENTAMAGCDPAQINVASNVVPVSPNQHRIDYVINNPTGCSYDDFEVPIKKDDTNSDYLFGDTGLSNRSESTLGADGTRRIRIQFDDTTANGNVIRVTGPADGDHFAVASSVTVTKDGNVLGGRKPAHAFAVFSEGVPAVSEWGLVVLTLLGMSVGSIILFRQREGQVGA